MTQHPTHSGTGTIFFLRHLLHIILINPTFLIVRQKRGFFGKSPRRDLWWISTIHGFLGFGDFCLSPNLDYLLAFRWSSGLWRLLRLRLLLFIGTPLPLIKTASSSSCCCSSIASIIPIPCTNFSFDFSGPRVSRCFFVAMTGPPTGGLGRMRCPQRWLLHGIGTVPIPVVPPPMPWPIYFPSNIPWSHLLHLPSRRHRHTSPLPNIMNFFISSPLHFSLLLHWLPKGCQSIAQCAVGGQINFSLQGTLIGCTGRDERSKRARMAL